MPTLSAGQTASLALAPGDSYTISTSGVAAVKVIYGAPAGTTTLTANFAVFGPYGVPAKLDVTAVSGSANYLLDQYEGVPLYGKENPLTGGMGFTGAIVDMDETPTDVNTASYPTGTLFISPEA